MKLRSVHSLLLIFLFSAIAIISCKKDIKNEPLPVAPGDIFPLPVATPVNGSVSGLIVDENNMPVEAAVARLGALSTTTNAKGLFSFDHATLDKYITTITVEMPGYFKAYRSFSANATRNYISIKLLPKTISGTVNSVPGGTISLSNGTQLSFQANSIVIKSTGAAYSGNVNVYAIYIDPTASDISATVPGSFIGRDGNNLYALQSTGMIAVELESDNGDALQLADNLPATIKMPIPASLLSRAPSVMGTWSLDEQGVWKKEGSAPRTGDFYEMQVTHFSFWNVDYPGNTVYVTLRIQDQNGNSIPNALIQLTVINSNPWWDISYGFTDSLGNVSGFVVAAEDLEMSVYPNSFSCGTPVSTQMIGQFITNTSQTITITVPTNQTFNITGTATDCSGSPLQSGTAFINAGLYSHYNTTITNGSYSITITDCNGIDTVNVTVFDYINGSQGSSGSVPITGNNITLPVVSACGGAAAAVFTFTDMQGNCMTANFSGGFNVGVPLSANDIMAVTVDVTTPGSYSINTAVVNGFSFSGTGTFANTGQQQVYLAGSGTPVANGSYTFTTQAANVVGCPFVVNVSQIAMIDLSSCSNLIVNGVYQAGAPLDATNTITVTMNVINPGQYFIYTNDSNGFSFTDSGFAATAGPVNFVLTGFGTAMIGGVNSFTLMMNGISQGCPFDINVNPSSTIADFIFDGAPGNCTQASLGGQYTAGVPINLQQNAAYLQVNVITPGAWSITTNSTNGIGFSGAGYFFQAGPTSVYLAPSGTPTNSGTYTFIPQAGGAITGCMFTVPVN